MGLESVNKFRVIVGVSVLFGIMLLIASSMVVNDWRGPFDLCKKLFGDGTSHPDCKSMQFYLIGGAMSIITALVQLVSSGLVFAGKQKVWSMLHVLVLILVIIALASPFWKAHL